MGFACWQYIPNLYVPGHSHLLSRREWLRLDQVSTSSVESAPENQESSIQPQCFVTVMDVFRIRQGVEAIADMKLTLLLESFFALSAPAPELMEWVMIPALRQGPLGGSSQLAWSTSLEPLILLVRLLSLCIFWSRRWMCPAAAEAALKVCTRE